MSTAATPDVNPTADAANTDAGNPAVSNGLPAAAAPDDGALAAPTSPQALRAARALGWTSLALGAAELAAPAWLCRQLGIDEHQALVRSMGAREVASGVGILAARNPAPGVWARVGGDALDLALLGAAAGGSRRRRGVAVAAALVAGITALDVWCALRLRAAPAA
jgi:hypothetical protein